eukprot:4358866-Prymnesium_polylepis.2
MPGHPNAPCTQTAAVAQTAAVPLQHSSCGPRSLSHAQTSRRSRAASRWPPHTGALKRSSRASWCAAPRAAWAAAWSWGRRRGRCSTTRQT